MGVNKLTLLGHVGQEPRISNFADGGSVANFSVAYTEKAYTGKNGQSVPEWTEWFNVVAKGSHANTVAQYVHKGDKIYVEGKIKTRQYTAQDGQTRSIMEVHVEKLDLIGKAQVSGPAQQPQQDTAEQLYGQPQQTTMQQSAAAPPQKDDDLPF